jgi:hypothetical protein
LARLTYVSYDWNDTSRWFDLTDKDGYSLRVLFSTDEQLPEKEAVVLNALREHVSTSQLKLDAPTRKALGISDYLP